MKYYTVDREAGNRIDCFETEAEAWKAIAGYEEADEKEGTYTPNFYDVYEVSEQ